MTRPNAKRSASATPPGTRSGKRGRPRPAASRPTPPSQPSRSHVVGRRLQKEGKPCTWNGEDGFWVTANGCHHDVAAARKASKAEDFQHLQRIDKEEQKQRRSLCARIAAAVEASGVPAPSASRQAF